jgi:molecular chaperone GrpE
MDKRFNDFDNEPGNNVGPDSSAGRETEPAPVQDVKPESLEGPDSTIEKLQTLLTDKDKEIAELKDRYLRVLADSENTRKRIRQQSEETVRLQRENFLRELLPIVDNLERAVEAARGGGNGKSIVEGVEMVLRSILDFLKIHGVTQLTSVGQPFDPQLHEAVDQIESSQYLPNTVVNEFHRGYLIGDRMLRPARVAVATGVRGSEGGNNQTGGDGIESC